ncbi:hypothetical protein [Xanthomonas arboricola]|uniref:hypothetical protein n=1 Tax=Xanthomonas arboricola TaxID=56448 RepID=UPI0016095F9B|nr:hypothetical protein [Xanthomonas arboricola]MBB4727929.1 hypothetical protein [Xanthomonas arboricola]
MVENIPYNYIPAEGWYMTHPNQGGSHPRTFYRVAMWRIDPNGAVVGLISLRLGPGLYDQEPVRLHEPPRSTDGQYVHWDDLTDEDRDQIRLRRFS